MGERKCPRQSQVDSASRSFYEDADFEDSKTQGVELSATEGF
jgi:hypothetical protein